MKRRKFLKIASSALIAGLLPSCSATSSKLSSPSGRIVFATDFHFENSWNIPRAARKLSQAIRNLSPNLVICGGDLISEGLLITNSEYLRRYQVFQSFLTSLGAPVVLMPGNHDISRGSASGSFKTFSALSGRALPYSALQVMSYNLIFLNSVVPEDSQQGYRGEVSEEQITWLKTLAKSMDKNFPIILFSHIPFLKEHSTEIFSSVEKVPRTHFVNNWREIISALDDFNIHSIVQGHTHLHRELSIEGILSITSGAVCGKWWCGEFNGSSEGFLVADIKNGLVDYSYQEVELAAGKPC